jgi:hypothetical protein
MSQPGNAPLNTERPVNEVLMEMTNGLWTTQLLHVAAKLRIADHLASGPKSVDALAEATGTHAPTLYRVLRALTNVRVFSENDDHTFALTPISELLRSDAPVSMRAWAEMRGEEWLWRSWGTLMYSLKTGEPAFDHVFGISPWEYFRDHPEESEVFNGAMTSISRMFNAPVVAAYDFAGIGTLVDVAGGHGSLLAAVLKANPSLRGILFDLPQVVEGGRTRMEDEGLSDRCEVRSGSFFEAVPEGADAYMLKFIIHDWNDDKASVILRNIHKALPEGGKVLVVDQVVPGPNVFAMSKFLDIEMLLVPNGRERNEEEFRALLEASGFALSRIVPTASPLSIVEGVKK